MTDIQIDNFSDLEYLKGQKYRYLHYHGDFNDHTFYKLDQCINMADKIKVIIIHKPIEYDGLIEFQRRTNIPIIYVPHNNDEKIWYWSMIGTISDGLFIPFIKILRDSGIEEEHHVMVGL